MSDVETKKPIRQTLQTNILKRILSDSDFEKLMADYVAESSKHTRGLIYQRDVIFNSPMTSFDHEIINFHFNSLDKSMSQFCREHNIKPYDYMYRLAEALAKKAKSERWSN